MSLETMFSSKELDAVFLPGDSDVLLITFAALDFSTAVDAFWGRHFALKCGFAAIGFVPRRNNWYPQADMIAAADALAPMIGRYPHRITYGSSMGAYGAVKYSRLFGSTACAAFGPQFSIDPADGVTTPAYTRYHDPVLHAGMAIGGHDVCDHPYVFYDPRDPFDRSNALSIAGVAPQTRLIGIPFAGHECIKVVAGLANTSALLKACLIDDEQTVKLMCRRYRLGSSARKAGIAGALVERRPELAFQIVERSWEAFDRKQLATFFDTAAGAALARGDLEAAERHALKAIDLLPDRTSFLRRLGVIYERARRFDDALAWYDRYLALVPDDVALLNATAGVNLALGRLEEADKLASKALAIAPGHAGVIKRLSAVRVAQGRLRDALTLLQEVESSPARSPDLERELARLLNLQVGKQASPDDQPFAMEVTGRQVSNQDMATLAPRP